MKKIQTSPVRTSQIAISSPSVHDVRKNSATVKAGVSTAREARHTVSRLLKTNTEVSGFHPSIKVDSLLESNNWSLSQPFQKQTVALSPSRVRVSAPAKSTIPLFQYPKSPCTTLSRSRISLKSPKVSNRRQRVSNAKASELTPRFAANRASNTRLSNSYATPTKTRLSRRQRSLTPKRSAMARQSVQVPILEQSLQSRRGCAIRSISPCAVVSRRVRRSVHSKHQDGSMKSKSSPSSKAALYWTTEKTHDSKTPLRTPRRKSSGFDSLCLVPSKEAPQSQREQVLLDCKKISNPPSSKPKRQASDWSEMEFPLVDEWGCDTGSARQRAVDPFEEANHHSWRHPTCGTLKDEEDVSFVLEIGVGKGS